MKPKNKGLYSTVLLIDDSRIDNFINSKVLEKMKFADNILIFNRTIKALEFLSDLDRSGSDEELIPSFIFLDLNMPVMSGQEFIEEYGKLSPAITKRCKIIVLTSSVDPADRNNALKNKNVIMFIHKPLIASNVKYILKEIEQVLSVT